MAFPTQLLALALLALACRASAFQPKELSEWTQGIITHYGGKQDGMNPSDPSFGTKEGGCGFGSIPKDKYPFWSVAALSLSNKFSVAGPMHACGQCFQIQCVDDRPGVCKTDSAGKPLSILVMISDVCPECGTDHIDVQSLSFAKVANPDIGRIKTQYRRVECTPPTDMQISVMDFRGAGGWIRLNVEDTGGRSAVKTVMVKGGNTDWTALTNSWGATWETSSAPEPPLSFKMICDDGEEVIGKDVIKQNGGIAAGAFGDKVRFATNVQFTITGPKVSAFSGDQDGDPMLITSAEAAASGGGDSGAAATASKCVDVPAPGEASCQQLKDQNKCGDEANKAYCAFTCGRCGGAQPASSQAATSSPSSPAPANAGCEDKATSDGVTCQQQKDYGKCEEGWLKDGGFCAATCGHCAEPKVQSFSGPSSGRRLLRSG